MYEVQMVPSCEEIHLHFLPLIFNCGCVCVLSEYGVRTQIPYKALCFVSHHQSLFSYTSHFICTHLSDVLFIYKCFKFHFFFALPTSQCYRLWIDRDFHRGLCIRVNALFRYVKLFQFFFEHFEY